MPQQASNSLWWIGRRESGTERVNFNPYVAWAAFLVFLGYYFGAKIGFALTFQPHPISVLWPPNALLLAALLLVRKRFWWILLLAAFPAHLLAQTQSEVPIRMIFCWFISNSFEAIVGAGCIHYVIGRAPRLNSLRNVAIFCLCGAFLAPFLSSFLDSAFVALNRWGSSSYWEIWRIRFSSNVLANLTITPAIVTWGTGGITFWRRVTRSKLVESACLLAGLSLISFVLFNKISAHSDSALLYAPLPFLLWAAVRFGARGATAASVAVAFLAIWGVAHGHGPFSQNSAEENALYVQLFLIFMSVPLLFLAALIEERDKTEEALRERDERIGLAAESGNIVWWTINYERGESWMSEKGRELFGFPPEAPLSGEVFLTTVHPEDRDTVNNAIERARDASENFEIEFRLLRPDGETRWLIARGRYLQDDFGEIKEFVGVAIDVTGQVKANLELRLQREEMTRLGRVALMGELTASLAHELNQPLTAIATNAAAGKRLLARGGVDLKMFEELLSDVIGDARRAAGIIHGIHDLLRKGEATRRAINLNDTIREVLRLLHSDLLARCTTVDAELAPALPPVLADPIHLQQLLLNLLMNAVEAMQETPDSQRRILISSSVANGFVQVHVRDHGIGLPESNPDRIFTQFFTTKSNGMGMGLAIARSIVEAHGGELTAENVADGARFSFRLPIE